MGMGRSVECRWQGPAGDMAAGGNLRDMAEFRVGDVPPRTPPPGQTQVLRLGEKQRDFPAPRRATFEELAFETLP